MADTPASSTPPEPRRASIPLSRPLWIALACVVLVVAGVTLRIGAPIWTRHEALMAMERLGVRLSAVEGGPKWLRQFLGDVGMKPFDKLRGAQFLDRDLTDADLANVRMFPEIEFLVVWSEQITDAGLEPVAGLPMLESLDLEKTRVTDAGLASLTHLSQLQELDLGRTKVTDAGLVHITKLTNLRELKLNDTEVTSDGVRHLCGLAMLRHVDLQNSEVADAGLVHVARLTNLQELNLANTRVTDIGLGHLLALKGLRYLILDGTAVTPLAAMNANMELPNRPLDRFIPERVIHPSDPFGVLRKGGRPDASSF